MRRDVVMPATAGGVLLLAAASVLAVFALLAMHSHAGTTASPDGCRVASSCGYHAPPLDPFLAPPPLAMAAPSPLRHPLADHERQPAEPFVAVLQRPPISA